MEDHGPTRNGEVISESELGPDWWDRLTDGWMDEWMDGWTDGHGGGGRHKQRIIIVIIFSFSGGTKRVNYGQMVLIDQVTRYKIMEFGSEM